MMGVRKTLLRNVICALTGCLAVAACSGSGTPPTKPSPTPYPGQSAAEPATAPRLTVPPAGRTVDVGVQAEGTAYDDQTQTFAVLVRDPPRLQLLDGNTLTMRRSVPLPGKGRHLSLARPGGPLLVADEGSDSLLQVPLAGGRIVATKVRHFPHDAAQAADGRIFVADEGGRALSVVQGGKQIRVFDDVAQPAGVAAIGDTVGVIDAKGYTMSTYDAKSLHRTARVAAGKGPTHVVATAHGWFVATDTRGNALLVYHADPLRLVRRIPLAGSPYGIAYDAGRDEAWVTLTALNQVVAVDPSAAKPRVLARFPTVQQPNTVAVGKRVYVVGAAKGVVQAIQP